MCLSARPGDRRKWPATRSLSRRDAFPVAGTTPEAMVTAADLAADHHFGIWDAVILSTASQTDCRLLLSEDLQDGFTWGGVAVANLLADRSASRFARCLPGRRLASWHPAQRSAFLPSPDVLPASANPEREDESRRCPNRSSAFCAFKRTGHVKNHRNVNRRAGADL